MTSYGYQLKQRSVLWVERPYGAEKANSSAQPFSMDKRLSKSFLEAQVCRLSYLVSTFIVRVNKYTQSVLQTVSAVLGTLVPFFLNHRNHNT